MVTALNELGDIERGVESGTNDFLTKPINKLELVTRVKSLLRVRHLKSELDRTLAYLSDMEHRPDPHPQPQKNQQNPRSTGWQSGGLRSTVNNARMTKSTPASSIAPKPTNKRKPAMLKLHSEIWTNSHGKRFVVLPEDDFTRITELLEDRSLSRILKTAKKPTPPNPESPSPKSKNNLLRGKS